MRDLRGRCGHGGQQGQLVRVAGSGIRVEDDEHQLACAGDAHPLPVQVQFTDLRVVEPQDSPGLAPYVVSGPELPESRAGQV